MLGPRHAPHAVLLWAIALCGRSRLPVCIVPVHVVFCTFALRAARSEYVEHLGMKHDAIGFYYGLSASSAQSGVQQRVFKNSANVGVCFEFVGHHDSHDGLCEAEEPLQVLEVAQEHPHVVTFKVMQ